MRRTDPHRVGAIIPTDYTKILWYALPKYDQPAMGIDCESRRGGQHGGDHCCIARLRQTGATFSTFGGVGKCSVCGAAYAYGEIWRHEPTGEHIHVGHDCADKYGLFSDRSAWVVWHRQQTRLRAQARREKKFKMAALRFLEARPALRLAMAALPVAATEGVEPFPVRTLRDMSAKLNRYGSLSEKQVEFAVRLAAEITNPTPVVEERHVPAPEGRVTVRGRIVSAKVHDGSFGSSYKMTVKVETPDGSWLVWATIPAIVVDCAAVNGLRGLVGREVRFDALLKRSDRDAHFAFGKRPTKAELLAEVTQ
jgi:hypothetical protein